MLERVFMELCMDLWSGDVPITYDRFIKEVNVRIKNLESHIGPEAHKKCAELGIIDNTKMSWEEQDEQCKKQIEEYQSLLTYLENDSNWTW